MTRKRTPRKTTPTVQSDLFLPIPPISSEAAGDRPISPIKGTESVSADDQTPPATADSLGKRLQLEKEREEREAHRKACELRQLDAYRNDMTNAAWHALWADIDLKRGAKAGYQLRWDYEEFCGAANKAA